MKKRIHFLAIILAMIIMASCSKSDVSENSDSNCYICSTESASIDVCEENGNFVIGGEVVENTNGASLEDLVAAVEANQDNDPDLEGISCKRK